MNKLPLNIIFFISTSGHFDHLDVYKTTIKHYKAKLGGSLDVFQNAFAHIKVKPNQRDRLPEIIDFLLENNIKPIVTEGEWSRGLAHGQAYISDIFKVFNTEEVHSAPYSFWVEDDSPINVKQDNLYSYLSTAVSILGSNKDIVNIRFQRDGIQDASQPINNFLNRVETFDFQPNIGRTRDLFLAAKALVDHPATFANVQCEAAFYATSKPLTHSPIGFLCFNPKIVSSHHIGAPNYTEIIKSPEFSNLNSSAPIITKWQP